MRHRLWQIALAIFCTAGCTGAACAQTPLIIGYTGVSEYAPIFIAKEEGYFKKHGLDVELRQSSQIAGGIISNSLQIGGVTTPVLLQAAENGLDLVAIAGGSTTSRTDKNYGLVVRSGFNYQAPKDLEGHRVGTQLLGAYLHVAFRKWLIDHGVDYKKVKFVEIAIPSMNDVVKAGSVDAVVVPEPFMSRIAQSGNGKVASYFGMELPEGLPAMVYVTTREFATKRPDMVSRFRQALSEGIEFSRINTQATQAHIAKYLPMPPEVLKNVRLGYLSSEIKGEQLNAWKEILQQQGLLKTNIDVGNLVER